MAMAAMVNAVVGFARVRVNPYLNPNPNQLHLCTASDYLRYGGDLGAMDRINAAAAAQLTAEGRRPYVIPVGGTTPTGT